MSRLVSLGLVVALLAACGYWEVSPEEWSAMSPAEKELTVKSLIGGEEAAGAKGGEKRRYRRPATDYVAEIDARYARGETRSVQDLWPELAD